MEPACATDSRVLLENAKGSPGAFGSGISVSTHFALSLRGANRSIVGPFGPIDSPARKFFFMRYVGGQSNGRTLSGETAPCVKGSSAGGPVRGGRNQPAQCSRPCHCGVAQHR